MDTLYIGDIPEEYCYAQFSSDYITLYNTSNLSGTLTYYRIYTSWDGFFYSTGTTSFGNYQSQTATRVDVSSNWLYRQDIDKIFTVVFIIAVMFIFVFNIATSVFRKGGVFSGLL